MAEIMEYIRVKNHVFEEEIVGERHERGEIKIHEHMRSETM